MSVLPSHAFAPGHLPSPCFRQGFRQGLLGFRQASEASAEASVKASEALRGLRPSLRQGLRGLRQGLNPLGFRAWSCPIKV